MTHPRTRMAAVVGGTALSISLALAPAALAQDDPTAPLQEVLTALSEDRFADATEPFIAELEAEALGGLGQLSQLESMGLGYDLDALFGMIAIDTSGLEITVAEEGAESAVLNMAGTLEVGFDEEGLVAFVMEMMSTEETPMDEEMAASMLPMITSQLEGMIGGSIDVDEQVNVVIEEGVWQVSDDLSSLFDALAAAMGAPTDGTVPGDE